MKIGYFALIFLTLFVGCRFTDSENELLISKITELVPSNILKNKKVVILIPRTGCTGCIDGVTKFTYDKKDSLDDILVVFTGVDDRKLLYINTDSAFLNRENVLIDNENIFMREGTVSVYPRVFYLNEKRVRQIADFNPHEYSIKKLLE